VAAVQAEAVPGDIAGNIAKAARLTGQAADAGARLVVFPEAFATGYDEAVFRAGAPELADTGWLAPLQEAVDATGTVVVFNTALDRGGSLALTDLVLRAAAPPLAAYDKQHLHRPEREFFTPGSHGASITIDGVRFALSVCYDANFPEHAAAAASDGADVYVNSGAYFPGGEHRRDLHYASRALDNGVYVVFSALVGRPSGFIGGSAVFDPVGRRIAAVDEVEGLAIADIDPQVIAQVRDDQRMWVDRRGEFGARTWIDAD